MWSVAWLSHQRGIGRKGKKTKILSDIRYQLQFTNSGIMLLYFASIEEHDIVVCFLVFQEIKVDPKKI